MDNNFSKNEILINTATIEDIKLNKGDIKYIKLDSSEEIPDGFETHILVNILYLREIGITWIQNYKDNDPKNNNVLGFTAYAMRDTQILKGDKKIAKIKIIKLNKNKKGE